MLAMLFVEPTMVYIPLPYVIAVGTKELLIDTKDVLIQFVPSEETSTTRPPPPSNSGKTSR